MPDSTLSCFGCCGDLFVLSEVFLTVGMRERHKARGEMKSNVNSAVCYQNSIVFLKLFTLFPSVYFKNVLCSWF